jgi:putative transposase
MREEPFLPRRRSVRLAQFDYSQSARYFLTICSQDRRPAFSKVTGASVELSPLGRVVNQCWIEIPLHFPQVSLGPHVVMPDHMHGIVIIALPMKESEPKARHLEMSADGSDPAKHECRASAYGGLPRRTEKPVHDFGAPVAGSVATIVATFKAAVSRKAARQMGKTKSSLWQRGYYEHVIRDEQDFGNACEYIRTNPARRIFERKFRWKHIT